MSEAIAMVFATIVAFFLLFIVPAAFIWAAWNCLAPVAGLPYITQPQALAGWFFVMAARWFVRSCLGVAKP
jgi:hypothetical protein